MSKEIPVGDIEPVIRTDFDHPEAWQEILSGCQTMSEDIAGFLQLTDQLDQMIGHEPMGVDPAEEEMIPAIDDPAFAGLSHEELLTHLPAECNLACLFVADREAMTHADRPVLVVDLLDRSHEPFRCIPKEVYSVQANLSLCNCDWEDFVAGCTDGIYYGFS